MIAKTTELKKFYLTGVAFLECFFLGGIMYGWTSLTQLFKEDAIFAESCETGNTNVTANSTNATELIDVTLNEHMCPDQESKLSLCFTIATVMFSLNQVLMGQINFKFGTRITRLIGTTFMIVGLLCLAFVSKDFPWLMFPGLSLVGMGGIVYLMTNFQVSNMYAKGRSVIVALLSGCFGASSAVFLLVKLFCTIGISRQSSLLVLAGLTLLTLINTFLFLPKTYIYDEHIQPEIEISVAVIAVTHTEDQTRKKSIVDDQPLRSYLRQPLMITYVTWMCLLLLRMFYFYGNVSTFLHGVLNDDVDLVQHYTNVFFYISLGGPIAACVAGGIYDLQKHAFNKDAATTTKLYQGLAPTILQFIMGSLLSIIASLLVLSPSSSLLYFLFVVMVMYRAVVYSMAAAFVTAIFPTRYFGSVYGITMACSGLVNMSQFGFFKWSQVYVEGESHVDMCFLGLSVVSLLHPAYVWWCARKERINAGKHFNKI